MTRSWHGEGDAHCKATLRWRKGGAPLLSITFHFPNADGRTKKPGCRIRQVPSSHLAAERFVVPGSHGADRLVRFGVSSIIRRKRRDAESSGAPRDARLQAPCSFKLSCKGFFEELGFCSLQSHAE